MRVVHFTLSNGSGLNRVSVNMATSETAAGLDSSLCFTDTKTPPPYQGVKVISMEEAKGADVYVINSHIPDGMKGKTVFVAHGTPEHCFSTALEQHKSAGYAAGDPFMLSMHRLNTSDVTVTFWDRHQYIWQSLNPKADVRCVPMGVDKGFWGPVESTGKWVGTPSFLSCENSHQIKWPLDIVLAFPLIMAKNPGAVLHLHYLPLDQHRWWYPLLTANSTAYKSFSSAGYLSPVDLRNAFSSVDYLLNPVRYGDFNSLCLEAKACGCKVISYCGNPYADYWIDEGDQREMADQITAISSGSVKANDTNDVPSTEEMAAEMINIYEAI